MSSFASKRKARVIKVDDGDDPANDSTTSKDDMPPAATAAVKFTRKPFRQSGLRRTVNASDDPTEDNRSAPAPDPELTDTEEDGPVVVRSNLGKSALGKQKKKRAPATRLSFGPGQSHNDDEDDDAATASGLSNLAARDKGRKIPPAVPTGFAQRLPMRRLDDEDDDRPKYSKAFLDELQSTTPNTPQNLSSREAKDNDDEMELDESELEGAVIVNEVEMGNQSVAPPTTILSNMEIQERKQRRAMLAREQDFISLDGGDGESDDEPGRTDKKQSSDTRLVREDEDLGEGFDDFVEDGGLSLGKKAEKEAKVRRRREMAEQIQLAEGNSDEESDESDAERRAAFEAAQTRSGMDGLAKPETDHAAEALLQVPPRITPLPEMEGCLEKLHITLKTMEAEFKTKEDRVAELKAERERIVKREQEVQDLLNEAGRKYTDLLGGGSAASSDQVAQSPARQIETAGMSELAVERGLESFGTTPNRMADTSDM